MKTSPWLLASALLVISLHGVEAFTNPFSNVLQSRSRCHRDLYVLHSTKSGDRSAALTNNIDMLASAVGSDESLKTAAVVDTTGMPKISIDESSTASSEANTNIDAEESYRSGLITIGFITLLFASNSPALHSAFRMTSSTPPVLLINAAVTAIGLLGVVVSSSFLNTIVDDPSKKIKNSPSDLQVTSTANNAISKQPSVYDNIITRVIGPSSVAGAELGLWKTLGTTANIYGLSQTSSDHGAFLIQLTTLIVPAAQGIAGVPIPTRIWTAIGLALGGVFMFTQDPTQSDCASLEGDLLCALAAIFYATYDLRLFKWGKLIPTDELITTKMATQTLISFAMLSVLARDETIDFITRASPGDLQLVGVVALWSGLAVNCLAPYLQVSGQQAIGPARAQILYASQPLWAAIMSFFYLGEQFGTEGYIGGSAFLGAMFLAATANMPDPDCPAVECEV